MPVMLERKVIPESNWVHNPNNGMSDLKVHLFLAKAETETTVIDANEVNAKQWISKENALEILVGRAAKKRRSHRRFI